MAAFTSTQTGNWNDGATWGNTSPGVKGTDWPGLAGDTASVGHTVTYNVSETNEMGAITITSGGILTFATNLNTKLTLGQEDITVQSGGELRVGASGAVIDKAVTAEVIWNTTADNAKGIYNNSGGKVNAYGDSNYYTTAGTTLADDVENTDGDTSIKTVDDMSAVWNVGDEITLKVEKNGDSSSYTDAIKLGVIQSISGTTIVLDILVTCEAGVGSTWQSPVRNVTRNVQFKKLGASTAIGNYNTLRPRFYDLNAATGNFNMDEVQCTGVGRLHSTAGIVFNGVWRNAQHCLYAGKRATLGGEVYSCYYGAQSSINSTISANIYACRRAVTVESGCIISGDFYSNEYGVYNHHSVNFSGDVFSNYYGFTLCHNGVFSGCVYLNYIAFNDCQVDVASGSIGYDSNGVSAPNTSSDWSFDVENHTSFFLNVKLPLAGLTFSDRNAEGHFGNIACEHHNRVANAHKTYDCFGDVVKTACDGTGDAPSADPDGGNGDCLELSNIQSLCDAINYVKAWDLYAYRIWAEASVAKTYTFKVQTTYAGIAAGGLELSATYLDEGSGGHLAEETDAPAISQRTGSTDWTQELAVTITPAQDGWITFMIKLKEYEAGNEVYIWPKVVVS